MIGEAWAELVVTTDEVLTTEAVTGEAAELSLVGKHVCIFLGYIDVANDGVVECCCESIFGEIWRK